MTTKTIPTTKRKKGNLLDYGLEILEAPKAPFVSLIQAKVHVRIEKSETYDDEFLFELIEEATEMIEDQADITLLPTKYRLTFDRFPKTCEEVIYLPRPPLVIVDAVKYFDTSGAEQNLDNSQFSTGSLSSVAIDIGHSWPATRKRKHSVWIDYRSGSRKPPARARRAILLCVAQWYHDREGERMLPAAAEALVEQLRPGDDFTAVA